MKFQYFKIEPSQTIKTRTSGVAVFSKTFYLLRQQKEPLRSPLISQEVKCDCANVNQ